MSRQAAQRLTAIAETWKRDPFRPNIQLQTFLKSLAQHPRLTDKTVDAVRALRDGDMQKKYELSFKTLHPPSSPLHYDRLVEGVEKSAQGIKRSWWKVFFGVW
ncbi:hypothetical protein BJ165DRAFT_1337797 [Panaeolus papilionaceus]|nr:hypothetical protein BJ165DRAFT_1337797 [Panaeolus papilionaceus]